MTLRNLITATAAALLIAVSGATVSTVHVRDAGHRLDNADNFAEVRVLPKLAPVEAEACEQRTSNLRLDRLPKVVGVETDARADDQQTERRPPFMLADRIDRQRR